MKRKRIIAWVIAIMMLLNTPFQISYAADETSNNSQSEMDASEELDTTETNMQNNLSSTDSITDNQENLEGTTESTQTNQQNNEEQVDERQEDDQNENQETLINYLVIDKPVVRQGDIQKILVSIGDENSTIEKAVLMYHRKSDDKVFQASASKIEADALLFEISYENNAETGEYLLDAVEYVIAGITHTITLEETGIDARYGVNEEVETKSDATVVEEDAENNLVDSEVVAFDESGNQISENSIEEAISDQQVVTSNNKSKMKSRAVAKSKDVVVVLDPGHGGSDPGASANGLTEKNLTLSIAKYCKQELEQYNGVKVYMTREGDTYPSLTDRVDMAKQWGANVLVSIHINSASPAATGAEVWYPNSNYNSAIHTEGEQLASQIQNQLVALGLYNRGIKVKDAENDKYADGSKADYYSIIRNSKKNGFPGIIVEHAFVTNASDANFMAQESNLQKLGIADATGIANYFGLSKGPSFSISNKKDYQGTANIKISGMGANSKLIITSESGVSKEYALGNGSASISFSIEDFAGERGNYSAKVYSSSNQVLEEKNIYISKDTSCDIKAENLNGKETEYTLTTQFKDMPSEIIGLQFATWSEEDGQDDIIWYSGTKGTNGEWTATADIRKHKTDGTYNVHVWATLEDGSRICLGATTFKVTRPSMQVSLGEYDAENGTFEVTISNVESASGVSSLRVPVWCAANQSDIKWYDAQKQDDSTYKVTVSMANHQYHTGIYTVHTYLTSENGLTVGIVAGQKEVTMPKIEVSAKDSNGKETLYNLKATNAGVIGGAIRNVLFATWSEDGGQDDIIWYGGTKGTNGEWTATADIRKHRAAGKYNVHAYAQMLDGSMKILGTTTFEVKRPSMEVSLGEYNAEKGTFEVTISNVESASGISSLRVPVWCAADQSDIKWYDAQKQDDSTYKVTVSMANHQYHTGVYTVHTYLTSENGLTEGIVAGQKEVTMPKIEVSAKDSNGKETLYNLKATNAGVVGGAIRNVLFATWSEDGGQDDIIWYGGTKGTNGEWTATADIRKHRTAGKYNVHVYAQMSDGSMKILGTTTFEVTAPYIEEAIKIENYDENSGGFTAIVPTPVSMSDVEHVWVPVWCSANQSDIKWYEAKKQTDGTYRVNIDPMYHNYNSGLYKIHAYVDTTNGLRYYLGSTSQMVNATKYYTIMGQSTVTVEQMAAYFRSSKHTYPAVELGAGGALTLEQFCQIYYEEAEAEGVRVEVAFAQAMKETGWLQYGGIVNIGQFNFAGIGALDGNSSGQCASFRDVREGVRAQIQHLKAYGCDQALNNAQVDPRFHLVTRGSAPYVEWLGVNENPKHVGWATAPGYGSGIVGMIKTLKQM